MNKKVLLLIIALFFCFLVVGGGAIFAFWWFSQAPQRALAAAMDATAAAKTVEFELTMTMDMEGEEDGEIQNIDLEVEASGGMDIENKSMDMELTFGSSALVELGLKDDIEARLVQVGDEGYMYNNLTDSWTESTSNPFDAVEEAENNQKDQPDISQFGTITYTGEESVNGETVYVYQVVANLPKLNEYLLDYMDEALESAGNTVTNWIDTSTINITDFTGEIKIYKSNGMLAQMDITFSLEVESDGETVNINDANIMLLFKNYNKQLDIEIPDEAREEAEDNIIPDFNFDM